MPMFSEPAHNACIARKNQNFIDDKNKIKEKIDNGTATGEDHSNYNLIKDLRPALIGWQDVDRAIGCFGNCLGNRITDYAVVKRLVNKTTGKEGNWVPQWQLALDLDTVDPQSINVKDPRVIVPGNDFMTTVRDTDGSNPRRATLEEAAAQADQIFAGCKDSELKIHDIACGARVSFVDTPGGSSTDVYEVQIGFSYYSYTAGYAPSVMIVATNLAMGMNVTKPQEWQTPFFSINGMDHPATLKSSGRKLSEWGYEESPEERKAKLQKGEGISVVTGPSSCSPTAASACLIEAPLKEKEREPMRSLGGSFASCGANDDGGEPVYCSLGAKEDKEPPVYRTAANLGGGAPPPKRAEAELGELAIGDPMGQTPALADAELKTQMNGDRPMTWMCTNMIILVTKQGEDPDMNSYVQAGKILKQTYEEMQKSEGSVFVPNRTKFAAVEAGISSTSPLKKKAKVEIAKVLPVATAGWKTYEIAGL